MKNNITDLRRTNLFIRICYPLGIDMIAHHFAWIEYP